jgi:hypothetical protein
MSFAPENDEPPFEHTVHILSGGTVFHVRPHLALTAPAEGKVGRDLHEILIRGVGPNSTRFENTIAKIHPCQGLTNADVAKKIDELVADPKTKVIFMAAALCDFEGFILDDFGAENLHASGWAETPSGKDQPRLKTSFQPRVGPPQPNEYLMRLKPADKIIGRIRKARKDIFLVGFKTTAGASTAEQFRAGLELLKNSSCNLVLANDVHTRVNMVITPEEARYHETTDRQEALRGLCEMTMKRSQLKYTRSTVVEGQPVSWVSREIPSSLREVVDHCIERGAYKSFLGSTVGHFAVKLDNGKFLTSRRKTNFNDLYNVGLVMIETDGPDSVIAHGSRPSVGGQSQRIVFAEHPDTDCIVHAHVPMRKNAPDAIPVRSQREFECGSHECGQNTSRGLKKFGNLYAVYLQNHGPNIVFHRDTNPKEVIAFIERNFDLSGKTGDIRAEPAVTA